MQCAGLQVTGLCAILSPSQHSASDQPQPPAHRRPLTTAWVPCYRNSSSVLAGPADSRSLACCVHFLGRSRQSHFDSVTAHARQRHSIHRTGSPRRCVKGYSAYGHRPFPADRGEKPLRGQDRVGGGRLSQHPSRRPHLRRHRLRRAAVPHPSPHQVRPGQSKGVFDTEVLHVWSLGVAPYADERFKDYLPAQLVLHRRTARADAVNRGAADYTPVLLSAVPRLFRRGIVTDRRGAHDPDVPARRAWLCKPGHQRGHRAGGRGGGQGRDRPGQRQHAARPRRDLPERRRHRLPRALR